MNCTDTCMICDKKLAFAMLKPNICDDSLCLFRYPSQPCTLQPPSESEQMSYPPIDNMMVSYLLIDSHEQFGLGVDPAAEIAASPEVVDLLLRFAFLHF